MESAISPERVIAKAVEIAGSDDFGPEGWREGLERTLDALPRMPLKPEALQRSIDKLVHDLSMRLRIEQWYTEHPEVADTAIEGPVFVVGLPRTGTTATVAMMALDERFRFLRAWEGASPVPPPKAGEDLDDPRAVAARAAVRNMPDHLHLSDPDGPEEDLATLAGLDMHSYHGTLPMPGDYIDWWLNKDFGSFYAYQERVLKLLHSQRPPHLWLLKSPPHLLRLREIARQYPNAKFVMTHRDPAKVIGSVASLHASLHEGTCLSGSIDPKTIGPRHLAIWVEAMHRALAARAEIGEDRFVDLYNDDVVKRPIEAFERAYDKLGFSLSPALRERLIAYNSRNAPGAFGQHRYTAEEYGLTDQGIRDAFGDYIERFGL